ncbi:hypothetical protein GC167_06245 [bacterium]|nr:hypothetical protein [bacterium]
MKTIVLLLGMAVCSPLYAQYSYASGGAFSFGVQSFPTAELLNLTPDAPELNATNLSFGGYGMWQIKRFVVGFKGAGIYGPSEEFDGLKYTTQAGYWSLDLGYKVINRDALSLYPVLGVGWGGLTYTVASMQEAVPTVPIEFNSAEFEWSGLVLDVGVRVEKLFGLKKTEKGQGGGFYGLELGYMFSPATDEFETAGGVDVMGGPEYGLNGFYARLLIGGLGGKP